LSHDGVRIVINIIFVLQMSHDDVRIVINITFVLQMSHDDVRIVINITLFYRCLLFIYDMISILLLL
jgi:hypothetical protein